MPTLSPGALEHAGRVERRQDRVGGFVADRDGRMDWIIMGDERANYMVEAIRNADTLMLGRKTYQGFASFWPEAPNDPKASEAERTIGERFNAMKKVVFSRSLQGADWRGTTLFRDIVPEEVRKLKEESETGIRLDGSISIVQQLTKLRLIDEYRLMVHPVALGSGRPLFDERTDLEFTGSERFRSGVVVLSYRRPAAETAAAPEEPMARQHGSGAVADGS